MADTTRSFWAPGIPRWAGVPFAGLGTFFFVGSVFQLVGVPVVKLEGNLWIGALIGGVFTAVGFWILLRGTRLSLDIPKRTYRLHTGLLVFGRTRVGTWDDFGPVEVVRESRSGRRGGTWYVWCVRLGWKDASKSSYELAEFLAGAKSARDKARQFADEIAALVGVKVLDGIGSKAAVRDAGEVIERPTAYVEPGALPMNSRVTILQDDRNVLRMAWKPERAASNVLAMVVPLVMLGIFAGAIVRMAGPVMSNVFLGPRHPPVVFMVFFGLILAGMLAAALGAIGYLGSVTLFKLAGSSEVTIDGKSLAYSTWISGMSVRAGSVMLCDVADVVLPDQGPRRRAIVVEMAGKDLKLRTDIPDSDQAWLLEKIQARMIKVKSNRGKADSKPGE